MNPNITTFEDEGEFGRRRIVDADPSSCWPQVPHQQDAGSVLDASSPTLSRSCTMRGPSRCAHHHPPPLRTHHALWTVTTTHSFPRGQRSSQRPAARLALSSAASTLAYSFDSTRTLPLSHKHYHSIPFPFRS